MKQFQVQRAETVKFSKVWSKNGIAVPLQDVHIDFATDFANVVLRNFILMCQQQAIARDAKKAPEKLITEG